MAIQNSEQQICCATYTVGKIELRASLLARRVGIQEQYRIVIEQQGECAACSFFGDVQLARSLFCDVVFGGVTACTLQDVVEDRTGTLFGA